MATQTTNYGLGKPAWDDMVDVSVLNNNSDIIDAQMHANELAATQAVANMADAYDATATYAEGDYCTYNGQLYICTTAVSTAEAFDISKWTATTAVEHFGGGGGGGGVNYSTTEQVIGTWIDGKTLYQKTYYYTHNDTISGGFTTIGTISGYEYLQFVNCMYYNPTEGRYYSIPYANGSATTVPYLENDNIQLRVSNDTWGSVWDVVITVQYTKTSS